MCVVFSLCFLCIFFVFSLCFLRVFFVFSSCSSCFLCVFFVFSSCFRIIFKYIIYIVYLNKKPHPTSPHSTNKNRIMYVEFRQ
jgi:hypothetical protein